MTEHQLDRANRLKAERDDIQGLINILTDNDSRFGVEVKKRYFFLNINTWLFNTVKRREFCHATREVLVKALCEQRDKLTKEIEKL